MRGPGMLTHRVAACRVVRPSIALPPDRSPEVLDPREMPDHLVQTIRDWKIIGAMLVNQITGERGSGS